MNKFISERNIVIFLFFSALILFSVAQENTRKFIEEQDYDIPLSKKTSDTSKAIANIVPR